MITRYLVRIKNLIRFRECNIYIVILPTCIMMSICACLLPMQIVSYQSLFFSSSLFSVLCNSYLDCKLGNLLVITSTVNNMLRRKLCKHFLVLSALLLSKQ